MEITKEMIREKLQTNQAWLERGVVAIFDKQTFVEQASEQTRELNGVGFNGPDASYLTYVAKWLLSGKHLSGNHLIKTRERMVKYAGQLERIALGEI